VGHKKFHPSYWYNDFAKLCHTMTIFGMHTKTENQLIRFVIAYLVADNVKCSVKCETAAAT